MKQKGYLDDEPLCWAVIAAIPAVDLERIVNQENCGLPSTLAARCTVSEGAGSYSAILCEEPGTEGIESRIALNLSLRYNSPVFALIFDPDRTDISRFEHGELCEHQPGLPRDFAAEMGIALPKQNERVNETYSVAFVEGATVSSVTSALGESAYESWLLIVSLKNGVLLRSEDGDIGLKGWETAEALPDLSVYIVMRSTNPARFAVHIVRGQQTIGALEVPAYPGDGAPALTDIKGARTPNAILAALGLWPELVGL